MTTGPSTGRLSTTEAARRALDLAEAMAHRAPQPPEQTVELTRNAKGVPQFSVTVRGFDLAAVIEQARATWVELDAALPYANGGTE